jgi:hypothetical protein
MVTNFQFSVFLWIVIALIVLLVLLASKTRAPYGRHTREGWGVMIDNKLGWIIMELPALIVFPSLALFGPTSKSNLDVLLICLWSIHYINRTLIFPFRIKTKGKKMPLSIILSAIFFNTVNGLLNGYYIGFISHSSTALISFNVLLGLGLFAVGFYINNRADGHLISLRKKDVGYQIPDGWLFQKISCPNHFGEIIEWIGFAIIAWNLPAVSFAVWTFSNLVPRALNHHAWYNENFENYPGERKAVIPYLL